MVVTATGLGILATQPASASCAAPQLKVRQEGTSIAPRRVRKGLEEQLLYGGACDQTLYVEAFNLTFDCNDAYAGTPGYGASARYQPNPCCPSRTLFFDWSSKIADGTCSPSTSILTSAAPLTSEFLPPCGPGTPCC